MKTLLALLVLSLAACGEPDPTTPDAAPDPAARVNNGCSTSPNYDRCLTPTCAWICKTHTCCLNGFCESKPVLCTPNQCIDKNGNYCGASRH